MTDFLRDLFSECTIAVNDGDGSCAINPAPHGPALRNLLTTGLRVRPIQLVHYASAHFLSRNGFQLTRLGMAFGHLSGALYRNANESLCLRRTGDHEWMGDVSEVLGVGIATLAMCRTLPARFAEISRIDATGPRCDFEVVTNGLTVIYEARGRNSRKRAIAAKAGLPGKKAARPASFKYGLISSLPNDGNPAELFIFDPPADDNVNGPTEDEHRLQIARHYTTMAAHAGLHTLAKSLAKRTSEIRASQKWIAGPLINELPNSRSTISQEGRSFLQDEKADTDTQWIEDDRPRRLPHRLNPPSDSKPRLRLEFGLDSRVVDALRRWDFSQIFDIPLKTHTSFERLIHIAEDGSLLRIVAS